MYFEVCSYICTRSGSSLGIGGGRVGRQLLSKQPVQVSYTFANILARWREGRMRYYFMLIVFHIENIEEYIAQLDYCSLSRMRKTTPSKNWGAKLKFRRWFVHDRSRHEHSASIQIHTTSSLDLKWYNAHHRFPRTWILLLSSQMDLGSAEVPCIYENALWHGSLWQL